MSVHWRPDTETYPAGTGYPPENVVDRSADNTYTRGDTIPAYVPDEIFQHERWDSTTDRATYSETFPAGEYVVQLFFIERFNTAVGDRVFNVYINNNQVLTNFDILAEVPVQTSLCKSFNVTLLTEGTITVQTEHVVANPAIFGISILGSSANMRVPDAPTNVAVEAGDGTATVTWTPVNRAAGYRVYRSTTSTSSGFTQVGSDLKISSFVNSGLTNNQTYHYKTRSLNDAGESTDSAVVSATPGTGETLIASLNVDAIPLGTMGATAIENSNYWTFGEPVTFPTTTGFHTRMTFQHSSFPSGYRFRTIVQDNIFGYSGRVLRCESDDDAGPRFCLEFADAQVVRCSYYMAFSNNFDWEAGSGKFPGLYSRRDSSVMPGTIAHCEPTVDPNNGFSARHTWLLGGGGNQYLYAKDKEKTCGNTNIFSLEGRTTVWPTTDTVGGRTYDRIFYPGIWYFIEQEIDVGNRDGSNSGTITSYVDGVMRRRTTNIPFTNGFGLKGFWHSNYYGGAHSVTDGIFYHSHKIWRVS